jgi:hypothetical protein
VQAVLNDADEITLHHKVIDKRDRVFAHSDSSAHEIEGWNYDGPTVQIYKAAYEPLTRDETRLLSAMIGKWIAYVEKLRSDVKQAL